jgi:hypothetical protein
MKNLKSNFQQCTSDQCPVLNGLQLFMVNTGVVLFLTVFVISFISLLA